MPTGVRLARRAVVWLPATPVPAPDGDDEEDEDETRFWPLRSGAATWFVAAGAGASECEGGDDDDEDDERSIARAIAAAAAAVELAYSGACEAAREFVMN